MSRAVIPFDAQKTRRTAEIGDVERSDFHSVNLGLQTLILGDCLSEMRGLKDGSVDVVVTSPPYNLGIRYGTYDDTEPRESYLAWMSEIAAELKRVLADNGSIFLNVAGSNTDPWIPFDVASEFRKFFALQNNITWVKSISIDGETVGHFKPINSKRFINHNHESIFHFSKSGKVELDRLAVGVPFKDKSNIARWGHKSDKRCDGNTWFLPYQTVQSKTQKFNHPAGFPVGLPEKCLKLHGQKNANVLDPFMGTGTTLVAAERLGYCGTGIELDASYLEAAIERMCDEVGH